MDRSTPRKFVVHVPWTTELRRSAEPLLRGLLGNAKGVADLLPGSPSSAGLVGHPLDPPVSFSACFSSARECSQRKLAAVILGAEIGHGVLCAVGSGCAPNGRLDLNPYVNANPYVHASRVVDHRCRVKRY